MTTQALLSDKDDHTIACPECDMGGAVYERTGENVQHGSDDDYRCTACGATFNEYVERERKTVGGGQAKYGDVSLEDVGLEPGAGP